MSTSTLQQTITNSLSSQGYSDSIYFFSIFDSLINTKNIIIDLGTTYTSFLSKNVKIYSIDSSSNTFECIGVTNVDDNGKMIFNATSSAEYFITMMNAPVFDENNITVVWEDDFDYTGLPDDTVWGYSVGNNDGWGNDEIEYYTEANPDNVNVSNGELTITARYSKDGLITADDKTYDYTSAKIYTKNSWLYGKFEITAKMPSGSGYWPAIWFLPENNAYGAWPLSGEIDLVEIMGGRDTIAQQSLQTYDRNIKYGSDWTVQSPVNAGVENGFHTYILTWTPEEIWMGVDGTNYIKVSRDLAQPFDSDAYPFVQPFYMILNIALGGTSGGTVDNSSFPESMIVNSIKVYDLGLSNFLLNNNANFNYSAQPTQVICSTDFSNEIIGWSVNNYGGESTYQNDPSKGELVVTITDSGTREWDVSAQWGTFNMVKGHTYKYSLVATSSIDRLAGFDMVYTTGEDNGDDIIPEMNVQTMTANTACTFSGTFTATENIESVGCRLFLGGGFTTDITYGDHTIAISEFELLDTSITVPAVEVETLTNPTTIDVFSQESSMLDTSTDGFNSNMWSFSTSDTAKASINYDDNPIYSLISEPSANINITNPGTSSEQILLAYTPMTLVEGSTYSYSIKIMSTITRDIEIAVANTTTGINYDLETLSLTANEPVTYTNSFTMNSTTDDSASFALYLGSSSTLDNHTVITSEISFNNSTIYYSGIENPTVNKAVTDENLTLYKQIYASDFTENDTGWSDYVATGSSATTTLDKTTGSLIFDISETGINNYDIQEIYGPLSLTADDEIMYYLTLTSTIDRSVTIVCQYKNSLGEYVTFFTDVVGLTANQSTLVSATHKIPDTCTNATFILDLGGNNTDSYSAHTVTVQDCYILNTSVTVTPPTYIVPSDPNTKGTSTSTPSSYPTATFITYNSSGVTTDSGSESSNGDKSNNTTSTGITTKSSTTNSSGKYDNSSTDSSTKSSDRAGTTTNSSNTSNGASSSTSSSSSNSESSSGKGGLLVDIKKKLLLMYLLFMMK